MAFHIERNAEPIPGYRLLEPLGRGGFGEVWKAEAPGGLLKAIKFVFGDLDDFETVASGAEQELRSLARVKAVRHPFLLSLERFDIVAGQLLIVTELADRDLGDRFRECRAQQLPGIPREELLRYLEEAAEVLDLMNGQHDLQHMDVKPQNLCLLHNHIKVADFGLVKDLTGRVASVTGGLTPKYAPPETFRGVVSRFSDQYSLAIVYQELLTGQVPFVAGNLNELMRLHTVGEPNVSALPEKEQAIVARALAKDPDRRHGSCTAFVSALRDLGLSPSAGLLDVPPTAADESPIAIQGSPTLRSGFTHPSPPPVNVTETRGDGILFPALVIGLGRFGLDALGWLGREVLARNWDADRLPHLRLLGIDTNADSVERAVRASAGALRREEVLLARVGRATRYLRPPDPLPPVQDWLPPKALYRIPRDLTTNGSRALGRLAFVDNYRSIVNRLRRDLTQVTAEDALPTALEQSGLGLRSNWPRVYVVASLAGGSGSGMLVDLAYVVRSLLRERSYLRAEVIGLFHVPPNDDRPGTSRARANAYAALVELNHFGSAGAVFQAHYDTKTSPLTDAEPPFTRRVLLASPARAETAGAPDLAATAGDYLFRELLTPLGLTADQARAAVSAGGDGIFDRIGVRALASPVRHVCRAGAGRLARGLLDRWAQKNRPELGPPIRQEVQERMQAEGLDPQSTLAALEAECVRRLGRAPEDTVAGWLEPVADARAPWAFDLARVRKILAQVEQFFGPLGDEGSMQAAPVPAAVRDAAEQAGERARSFLATLIPGYMDRPGYRLAATGEAVTQASALVERWLQRQDAQTAQLTAQVQQLAEQLRVGLIEVERTTGGKDRVAEGRRARLVADLARVLVDYPKARSQQALANRVTGLYLSLRGYLSDQVREVGFYRQPLEALRQSWPEEGGEEDEPAGASCSLLLPSDCHRPDEVADRVLLSLTTEDWLRLDGAIQDALTANAQGPNAVSASLRDHEGLTRLRAVLAQEAAKFLAERLSFQDAAGLFLAQQPDEAALARAIREAFDAVELAPNAAPGREMSLVLAPGSESGRHFLEAVGRALPEAKGAEAGDPEEIVFYREQRGLSLEELERAGLICPATYARACSLEGYAPHTRVDVPGWALAGKSE